MEKKCKVVLFSSYKKTGLYRHNNKLLLGYPADDNILSKNIFILSNDEIKKGDFYYRKKDNIIVQSIKIFNSDDCNKIIATTNTDLIKEGIASINNEFVKHYCDNPHKKVLVEYEEDSPKIKDGYIIIKPVEETWDDIFNQELPKKLSSQESLKIWLEQNYNVPTKK